MTPLFLYLLKVNIALVLFYLAYRYGLRRLTFYTLNRFFLLFAIGFSSVYPLIDVNALLPGRNEPGGQIIHYLPNLDGLAQESPLELWNVLTLIFWSGVVVMAIRFVVQCVSLARIHFTSVKQPFLSAGQAKRQELPEGQELRIVTEKINPFSFFRNIYINPLLHSAEEQRDIIAHERVHAKEWHTADILAGELNRIFYWFNPGAWLMITAIRENLEFITDRKVLQSGADAKSYQYSLVRASNIPYASALANNFNFSHLKIRITMMDKKPSSELHLVKYLVLIPFVAALALGFNVTRAAFTPPVIVKFTEPLIVRNDTLPEKAPSWETSKDMYKDNFTGYAKTMASISHIGAEDPVVLDGKLTNGRNALNAVRKEGIGFAAKLENELAQYYVPGENLLYWLETKSAGRAPNRPDFPPPPEVKVVRFSPPKADPGKKEPEVKEVRFTPPTIVPKKEKEGDTISPPPPAVKEKPDHAASSSSLDAALQSSEIVAVEFSPVNKLGIRLDDPTGLSDKIHDNLKSPLIIVDGVPMESRELAKMDPNAIARMTVFKGEKATAFFGKKGKDGIVVIVTKDNADTSDAGTQKDETL